MESGFTYGGALANQTEFLTARLPKEIAERFKKRLPKRGDRAKVIRILITKYLNGDVIIITK